VLKQFSREKSTFHLLGGHPSCVSIAFLLIGTVGMVLCSFVAAFLYVPLNEKPSFPWYQAQCLMMGVAHVAFFGCLWFILGAFVKILEQHIEVTTKTMPGRDVSDFVMIAKRFDKARKSLLPVVGNIALYICNALVFPYFFYYVAFLVFCMWLMDMVQLPLLTTTLLFCPNIKFLSKCYSKQQQF
jgi:hypothetical protein